ncbi:hypothetical protein EI94DRAFT_1705409 [Lactarius quietus]|nr:hypothetical protein EI94DRAFT_1705409 [Lactarius quietus]
MSLQRHVYAAPTLSPLLLSLHGICIHRKHSPIYFTAQYSFILLVDFKGMNPSRGTLHCVSAMFIWDTPGMTLYMTRLNQTHSFMAAYHFATFQKRIPKESMVGQCLRWSHRAVLWALGVRRIRSVYEIIEPSTAAFTDSVIKEVFMAITVITIYYKGLKFFNYFADGGVAGRVDSSYELV